MNGASSEPAVNAIFLPLRSAALLMPPSLRHQKADIVLLNEARDRLYRKPFERAIAIGASEA